mmetsp:Transcript_25009/g.77796  ORF Transcript_25009/g.77796 Transcript_25009/m.77796 type:complete len:333 (-) Transcript_25009:25-1023(-)
MTVSHSWPVRASQALKSLQLSSPLGLASSMASRSTSDSRPRKSSLLQCIARRTVLVSGHLASSPICACSKRQPSTPKASCNASGKPVSARSCGQTAFRSSRIASRRRMPSPASLGAAPSSLEPRACDSARKRKAKTHCQRRSSSSVVHMAVSSAGLQVEKISFLYRASASSVSPRPAHASRMGMKVRSLGRMDTGGRLICSRYCIARSGSPAREASRTMRVYIDSPTPRQSRTSVKARAKIRLAWPKHSVRPGSPLSAPPSHAANTERACAKQLGARTTSADSHSLKTSRTRPTAFCLQASVSCTCRRLTSARWGSEAFFPMAAAEAGPDPP